MIIAALLLAQQPSMSYMSHAAYPAKSLVTDTEAIGGFGEASNLPLTNTSNTPQGFVTLARKHDKISVTLANSTQEDMWLRAADGNLIMWLEAKDGDSWKPIQYHHWYTCGNSYHRVAIPAGYHFTFEPIIPAGTLKTEVRLAYYDSLRRDTGKPQYSTSLKTPINPQLFELDPQKSADQKLTTEWVTPTLVPKR